MNKYLLTLEGSGEGCDYSIDCNKTYREIEGNTPEEAFGNFIMEHHGIKHWDEIHLDSDEFSEVKLYRYEDEPIEIDYESFCDEHNEICDSEEIEPEENKDIEYQYYLKLKEKFDKSENKKLVDCQINTCATAASQNSFYFPFVNMNMEVNK